MRMFGDVHLIALFLYFKQKKQSHIQKAGNVTDLLLS